MATHADLGEWEQRVQVVPVLEDNFSYLVVDAETREAAVVDPVDPKKVKSCLNRTCGKIVSTFPNPARTLTLVTISSPFSIPLCLIVKVKERADALGLRLTAILTTHSHWDHCGGNLELLSMVAVLVSL
jgi:hydroxyacylglutathione hydrolase